MNINPALFPDVADTLGIGSPAIIEKDVYAVALLQLLSAIQSELFYLVFGGGTSLAKVYHNTYRMSEDIDIKLVAREEDARMLSRTALKAARKDILLEIENVIHGSDFFFEINVLKRNEYRFAEFTVTYPRTQPSISALRPHLKLDVTASELLEPFNICTISSLYAETLKHPPEISDFPVASIGSTISEKLIALLRRTAQAHRDISHKDDEMLIRHVYDLHMSIISGYDFEGLGDLLKQVIQADIEQFGRQHPQFLANPIAELYFGLECLSSMSQYELRYERFIGPLVYHDSPASWNQTIQTVSKLLSKNLPRNSKIHSR